MASQFTFTACRYKGSSIQHTFSINMPMDICVAHSRRYRCRLEFIINQLRNADRLTAYQALKIASFLCTCKDWEIANIKEENNGKYKNFVFSKTCLRVHIELDRLMASQRHHHHQQGFTAKSVKVTMDMLDSLSKFNQQGYRKFMTLVDKIIRSDLNKLIPDPCRHKNGRDQVDPQEVMPLPWTWTILFLGKRSTRSQRMKQNSDCKVREEAVSYRPRGQPILNLSTERSNVDKTSSILLKHGTGYCKTQQQSFNLWAPEQRVVNLFNNERKKKQEQSVTTYLAGNSDIKENVCMCENIKDINRDRYDKLNSKHIKGRNISTKVKGHRLLVGSRCLNCLKTFVAIEMKQVLCKYHPGYVLNNQWTCCGVSSADRHASHADHSKTGCFESNHNWRPKQKHHRNSPGTLRDILEREHFLLHNGVTTPRGAGKPRDR